MNYNDIEPLLRFQKQQISSGSNFMERTPTALPLQADITDNELLARFVELVERAPEFGWRAGKALGVKAFETPAERPPEMPRRGIVTIEASFGDRGPSKAKRQREDRIAARFDVSLQVSTTVNRGVSSAAFRGRADFYEPRRAVLKAMELSKATKCRTPFSEAYRGFIEEVAEGAEARGMLVGFIHTKPETGGTYYHEFQVVLASRVGLEAHALDDAVIMLGGEKGLVMIELPPTSKRTSKGNAMASKFVMQSRGEVKSDHVGNS